MNKTKAAALAIVVFSIAMGAVLGLFPSTSQPPSQQFSFVPFAIQTATSSECPPVSKNYTYWLVIDVKGNRTAINFQSVSIFSPSDRIQVTIPLNQTSSSFVSYQPVNSTLERLYVPLPDYFRADEILQISISYFITGYPVVSQTLPEIPVRQGSLAC